MLPVMRMGSRSLLGMVLQVQHAAQLTRMQWRMLLVQQQVGETHQVKLQEQGHPQLWQRQQERHLQVHQQMHR
jgi:hypothetical protein